MNKYLLETKITLENNTKTFYFNSAQTLENFIYKHKYYFWDNLLYPQRVIEYNIVGWTRFYQDNTIVKNSRKSFNNVLYQIKPKFNK